MHTQYACDLTTCGHLGTFMVVFLFRILQFRVGLQLVEHWLHKTGVLGPDSQWVPAFSLSSIFASKHLISLCTTCLQCRLHMMVLVLFWKYSGYLRMLTATELRQPVAVRAYSRGLNYPELTWNHAHDPSTSVKLWFEDVRKDWITPNWCETFWLTPSDKL